MDKTVFAMAQEPYRRDCTDYLQRISNNVTKWPLFKLKSISIRAIGSQSSNLQLTVCVHWKSEVSLSLGRGRSGYEIRRAVRLVVSYSGSAMLRLFRDKHIYSLAFAKSLQISKVIRCAAVNSEKPSQVYIWNKSQRKTKEDENSP